MLKTPAHDIVVYLSVDPEESQKLLTKRYAGDMSKEDIHEKDREYLKRCQEAASYCADHLGWKAVDCTEDGSMRSIGNIQHDNTNIIRNLM